MVRRTKEDAAATRNSLIDAAERVFYDKGVSRASLSDIAHEAGATRGAIYWHFKNKVDLFHAMMERATLPLECAMNGYRECAGLDALGRARAALTRIFVGVSVDERTRRVFEVAIYRVEYVEELQELRARHREAAAGFTAQLAHDLREAAVQQEIVLPVSADEAAVGLYALFDGLIRSWLLGREGFDLQLLGARAVDSYLRGLGFRVPFAVQQDAACNN